MDADSQPGVSSVGNMRAFLKPCSGSSDEAPDKMAVRRQTVEHPRSEPYQGLDGGDALSDQDLAWSVSTEMSLHVLACNLKRVMKVLGVVPLMEAMRA